MEEMEEVQQVFVSTQTSSVTSQPVSLFMSLSLFAEGENTYKSLTQARPTLHQSMTTFPVSLSSPFSISYLRKRP